MRFLALALLACAGRDSDPPGVDVDADADTDADADADADADTDADTDVLSDLDCTPGAYPTPDPGQDGLPACVTDVIACGQRIFATNLGGSTSYGTATGEPFAQCSGTASGQDLAGPERVYKATPPPEVYAMEVYVRACQPTAVFWHRGADCPSSTLDACSRATCFEGGRLGPWDSLIVATSSVNFVVEGYKNDGGNFEIELICFDADGRVIPEETDVSRRILVCDGL